MIKKQIFSYNSHSGSICRELHAVLSAGPVTEQGTIVQRCDFLSGFPDVDESLSCDSKFYTSG